MKKILASGIVRTPIGTLNGGLSKVSAVELGKAVVKESLSRSGIEPEEINEVIFGNVLQAGQGQNPARQIAIGCGIPIESPSFTVNQVCGSGMKAIELAMQSIMLGKSSAVVAGGTESMSQAPYILSSLRSGAGYGRTAAIDTIEYDGLTDAFGKYHMGITAENLAEKFSISRKDQDIFAAESQQRCEKAVNDGQFDNEIVSIISKQRKKEITISKDEHPRPGTTPESLSKLRPVFKEDGTVTAGNASGINDGAAALVLIDESEIQNKADCVYLKDLVCTGCEPEYMGLGPVYAVQKLLKQNNLTVNDIDLWEMNEAFAVQSIAVIEKLKLDNSKVNISGGAIAFGHPIGTSGARIAVTLINHMKRRQANLGVASLCVGGGMGLAALFENI